MVPRCGANAYQRSSMFCDQCQETMGNKGCNLAKGVCGKEAQTADLQDLLTYAPKGEEKSLLCSDAALCSVAPQDYAA